MAKKRKPRVMKMNIKELADFVHGKSKATVRVVKIIPPKIDWRKVWEKCQRVESLPIADGCTCGECKTGRKKIERAVESQLNPKGKK